jgi:hypothetical protein
VELERTGGDILSLDMMAAADEIGIRLESIGGLTVWERAPFAAHQARRFEVQRSIGSKDRPIWHYSDVVIRFPDGSKKRPDIAIFCSEPEQDEEIEQIPEAAIEILSRGYEKKDLVLGVALYKKFGVKDVIVLEPISGKLQHFSRAGERTLQSPIAITLECGYVCTV